MTSIEMYRPGIDEVKGNLAWSALEHRLLDCCQTGAPAGLPGKTDLPPDCSDPDRRVRAGLIRYLMLGGCDRPRGARPHPNGVRIMGGWIDGVLDLESCQSPLDLWLQDCLLPERANLHAARIGALFLPGCAAPQGLDLQQLTTRDNVHLREGFKAGAGVDLGGARIGGHLACTGGAFEATEGRALNCNGARIGASVFLIKEFRARAEVNFGGAEIGGQLACDGGAFEAKKGQALNCDAVRLGSNVSLSNGFRAKAGVNFRGAEIGGQLASVGGTFEATEGLALTCNAARIGADVFLKGGFRATAEVDFARADVVGALVVTGAEIGDGIGLEAARIGHGFFWKNVTGARRKIDLTEARVGSLRDDRASWEGVDTLILHGFRYDRIDGSMSVTERIAWLGRAQEGLAKRQETQVGPAFDPQPHVQLATILRAQGDRTGAALVLVDREKRQRRAMREWRWKQNDSPREILRWAMTLVGRPVDFLFWLLAGYGHRPARALGVSIVLVLLASGLAHFTYEAGQFAPNSDIVLTSADWLGAVAAHEAGDARMPVQIWQEGSATAQDYETFQPLLYGLDLFIPLDALGQEEAWRPSTERGVLGKAAFYSRWFFQGAGWIITALAAAVLTGLVGRRD